jgi:hypothetical protein
MYLEKFLKTKIFVYNIKDKEKKMINVTNVGDAVTLLVKDNEVFEQLKKDFSPILADLITFKNNPNCTCRGKVFKFFTEEIKKDSQILDKYIKNTEEFKKQLLSIVEQRNSNNYSGRIIKIENTEEAWKSLTMNLLGKSFRTFSVIEKGDKLWVYLL